MTSSLDEQLFAAVEESPWKKRLAYGAAAAFIVGCCVCLGLWYFRGEKSSGAVDEKLTALDGSAQTAGRRASAVVDAVKSREVTARARVQKTVSALPDDAVADALAELLRVSRGERGR